MSTTKTGYKLLIQSQSGELISYGCPFSCKINYKVNEWSYRNPANGPIAIYTELFPALRHFRIFSAYNNIIYECEYLESNDSDLWGWVADRIIFTSKEKLDPDTIFADMVRLIKKVDISKFQFLFKRKKGTSCI
jgi:hypothetical protein